MPGSYQLSKVCSCMFMFPMFQLIWHHRLDRRIALVVLSFLSVFSFQAHDEAHLVMCTSSKSKSPHVWEHHLDGHLAYGRRLVLDDSTPGCGHKSHVAAFSRRGKGRGLGKGKGKGKGEVGKSGKGGKAAAGGKKGSMAGKHVEAR